MSRERYTFPKEIILPYDDGVFARSALVACLTDDECRLSGIPDTTGGQAVLDFLAAMGYTLDRIDDTQMNLTGNGYMKPREPRDVIDCAGSSDLAHIFAACMCGWNMYGVVRCANPHHSLSGFDDAINSMGGRILGRSDGCAPPWCVIPQSVASAEIRPSRPHPSLRSALGLVYLLGQGTGAIPGDTPGYDGFERTVGHYRGEIRRSEGRLHIKGGERVLAKRREMPRGFRLAVPAIVMAASTSAGEVRLPGVCLNPTRASALDHLGRAGVDFSVDNMADIDGEPAADIIVKPSTLQGIELGAKAVRLSYEDLPSLITLACISEGLSEFDLSTLAVPEREGAVLLTEQISTATGASFDSGNQRITIEGNPNSIPTGKLDGKPNGIPNDEPTPESLSAITDYPARVILAVYYKIPGILQKDDCISELGKSFAQVILGELLF